jgi:hypothetical protein
MSGRIGPKLALGALALLAGVQSTPPANAGSLHKVVEEGEVLPDGSTVQTIDWACGSNRSFRPCIAIGGSGHVAFYGSTAAGVEAIFTQAGVLVENGGELPDGSTVGIDPSSIVGGLASNGRRRLAFPGLDGTDRALFTRTRLVVKQGETLPDGTAASINFLGGVAIVAQGGVSFHGSNAVFTDDGRITQARDTLPDGTVVGGISFFGGVASAGWTGRVAFHGFTDNRQAIFTQDGLVAEVGELPDGTALDSIDLFGGLAVNGRGEIAFHGRTAGHDAVFNQHGLIARAGDTLPDGTVLDAIQAEGGVAINGRGIVVFHGVTGGKGAVFTQYGLLAEEGEVLADGTVLERIRADGGVAINFRGEVAFHGEAAGKGAVFVFNHRLRRQH